MRAQRYGAIDIGTNTVRLLIAEKRKAGYSGKKWVRCTRIGEGLQQSGKLGEAGIRRTLEAVEDFLTEAKRRGCALPIYCYATSAVREAQNGKEFLKTLEGLQGLSAEIISGEMEAQIGFLGASGKEGVVLDIGGGSTELVRGEQGEISAKKSVRMGVVTLLEADIQHDPPQDEEIERLFSHIRGQAEELCKAVCPQGAKKVIGVGGTATQLAMLFLKLPRYNPKQVQGYRMDVEQLENLFWLMARLPLEQRKKMAGMDPQRADVILPGCAILISVLKQLGAQAVWASDSDGLDGYLMQKMETID